MFQADKPFGGVKSETARGVRILIGDCSSMNVGRRHLKLCNFAVHWL